MWRKPELMSSKTQANTTFETNCLNKSTKHLHYAYKIEAIFALNVHIVESNIIYRQPLHGRYLKMYFTEQLVKPSSANSRLNKKTWWSEVWRSGGDIKY